MDKPILTQHAISRMTKRRISEASVEIVCMYGRRVYTKGATYYVVGRREVEKYSRIGVDLKDVEGVHVVCSDEEVVMTTYKNHDLSGLRPRTPRSRRFH